MGHTYSRILVHCVFSTKDREPLLTERVCSELWPYMGGIARSNDMAAIEVGGYFDHAHILLALRATQNVASAMREIKAGSSKYLRETGLRKFGWQEGYGAFSIGESTVDDLVKYIRSQDEHHRHKSFQEEFVEFLTKYGIEYDPRYVWG